MNVLNNPLTPTMAKAIGWSYPSSPNAVRFGFSRTGCYSVNRLHGSDRPKSLAGFATWAEAKAFADTLDGEYSRFSMPEPRDSRKVVCK